jgi:predicted transcriptional regulator with HTH domain
MTPRTRTSPYRPDPTVVLSLRRSTVRLRVLLALASLGKAYPAQLAREAGLDPRRVTLALRGRPPIYRDQLSLVKLGLARWARGTIEITARGRAIAAEIRGGRAARVGWAGSAAGGHVAAHARTRGARRAPAGGRR